MYKTVSIHEMQQYGHRDHYKVDTFLIKIYSFRIMCSHIHTDF